MRAVVMASVGLLLAAAGCGGPPAVEMSEVSCPPQGTTLTYQEFGEPFLSTWCQSCHGAAIGGRNGAKIEHDFGTQEAVVKWRARIFANAAASNTFMPPGPDDPPADQRSKLAEWLACGAP